MTYEPHEFARVGKALLLASATAWIVLLFDRGSLNVVEHCAALKSGAAPPIAPLPVLSAVNPPASLVMGWAAMLVAMMSPVLIAPICHIRLRSFTDRRTRSVALFVSGYTAVWLAMGYVLCAIALAAKFIAPRTYLPLAGAAILAILWQVSPLRQRCLNGCHGYAELPAFGAAADFGALRFGVGHAIWCIGSCWALMLFPMLLSRGHLWAMAAVALVIAGERLESPAEPSWRWRGLRKATRLVAAQARLRLHALQKNGPLFSPGA